LAGLSRKRTELAAQLAGLKAQVIPIRADIFHLRLRVVGLVGHGQTACPRRAVGELAPLLPPPPPRPRGGRPRVPDRATLTGILFVLKSGIPWEMLPWEMGCGSGMTCWRRLRDWQRAGVWARLHRVLLDRLGRANAIDWSRCALDSAAVAAKRGVPDLARTTTAVQAVSAISWSTQAGSRSLSA
jgi:transposase